MTVTQNHHDDWLGSVDHLVVHVDAPAASAAGFAALRSLVDAGTVRVLDLEVLHVVDGAVVTVDAGSWGDGVGLDLHALDGTYSGLLDDDDRSAAVVGLAPGSWAVVVVHEVRVLHPVVTAWSGAGTSVVSEGPVVIEDLTSALDDASATATESEPS